MSKRDHAAESVPRFFRGYPKRRKGTSPPYNMGNVSAGLDAVSLWSL